MARILPSAKRSRKAPSLLRPAYSPCNSSPSGSLAPSAHPLGCACTSHWRMMADNPAFRQVASQRWNISARISTAACASGGVAPNARKSEALRSRLAGCQTRFAPIPTTIASPVRSNRMPQSLAPFDDSRSFGHLIWIATCGAICRSISCAASAATKPSVGGAGSVLRNRTMVLTKRLPAGLSHWRPNRPRPPS